MYYTAPLSPRKGRLTSFHDDDDDDDLISWWVSCISRQARFQTFAALRMEVGLRVSAANHAAIFLSNTTLPVCHITNTDKNAFMIMWELMPETVSFLCRIWLYLLTQLGVFREGVLACAFSVRYPRWWWLKRSSEY